jgi:hypothetical protein
MKNVYLLTEYNNKGEQVFHGIFSQRFLAESYRLKKQVLSGYSIVSLPVDKE